jgi:hypothetical protein
MKKKISNSLLQKAETKELLKKIKQASVTDLLPKNSQS